MQIYSRIAKLAVANRSKSKAHRLGGASGSEENEL